MGRYGQSHAIFILSKQHISNLHSSTCKVIGHLPRTVVASSSSISLNKHDSGLLCLPSPNTPVVRHGHKKTWSFKPIRSNPQYIEHFEYSGDLRTLPKVDEKKPLYEFKDLSDIIGDNEFLKKLSSIEFGTEDAKFENKEKLITDRIQELFGPDSELEQEIALMTLEIRESIPISIAKKLNKRKSRWVTIMIENRKEALTKLRELDNERFEWLVKELKIQYIIPRDAEPVRTEKEMDKFTKNRDVINQQRKKLEDLKAQYQEEKKTFYERKAKVLEHINKDLEAFGLEKQFLQDVLVREREEEKEELKDTLTWDERAKMGMTAVKHVFPPKPIDPRLVKKYEIMEARNKQK